MNVILLTELMIVRQAMIDESFEAHVRDLREHARNEKLFAR